MERKLSLIPGVPASMVLLVVLGLCQYTHAACSAYFGPSGSFDCVSFPEEYDKPQYATCLTNTYIQQKSKGRHVCYDQSRTYCYYQCMLELHGEGQGNVTDDCACDPYGVITTRRPGQTTLDPTCLSPSGADCSWYRNCMQSKFQCEGSSDDYAIGYAAKLCTSFVNTRPTLSQNGTVWMDAVRKCLQVAMVPVLRSFYTPTCAEIRQRAFDSHADCYLQPYEGAPSICDLPLSDFWTVFWTMRSAFLTDFSQSVFGLLQVRKGCSGSEVEYLDAKMRNLVIKLRLPGSNSRNRRSADTSLHENPTAFLQEAASALARHRRRARDVSDTDVATNQETELEMEDVKRVVRQAPTTWRGETDTALYYHKLANLASKDMARQLDWDAQSVTWFASDNYTGDNSLEVHILLADSRAYGVYTTGGSQPNMTAVVVIAAKMFEEGEITVTLEGQRVQLETLTACTDLDCQTVYLNATASTSANASVCNAYLGPLGSYDCIPAAPGQYDKPQYGACVTKAYIEQSSKGRHTCPDPWRKYCHYLCMRELHALDQGTVTDNCACDPDGTRRPDETKLYATCLSPVDGLCSWYRDCLRSKFQCEGSSDDHAIGYAEKFCTGFISIRNVLSYNGSSWMDAVRKCLQA